MQLTYDLGGTTVELTPDEMTAHHDTISRAKRSEERKGRKVTVLVRLEIHEASDKQTELAPKGRLFPRPLCALGAIVPVLIADKLRSYAQGREQPLSDLTRVLWTEFLIAKDKRGSWSKFIESKLNDVQDLRTSKKKISYARTRQMQLKRGRRGGPRTSAAARAKLAAKKLAKKASKKKKKKKATKKAPKRVSKTT